MKYVCQIHDKKIFTLHFTVIQAITSNLLVAILFHTVGQRGAWMFDSKRKRPSRASGVFPDSHFLSPLVYRIPFFCLFVFVF